MQNFRLGPLFTPPMLSVEGGLQGTIQRPHIAGGASWSGAAADPDLPPLGGEGHGGPLLTKTLLVSALSAGGSDGGPRLVARDKASGAIVASLDLPSGAIGTPMTYLHEGRQYIALTIGGDVPELIGLALP